MSRQRKCVCGRRRVCPNSCPSRKPRAVGTAGAMPPVNLTPLPDSPAPTSPEVPVVDPDAVLVTVRRSAPQTPQYMASPYGGSGSDPYNPL